MDGDDGVTSIRLYHYHNGLLISLASQTGDDESHV